MAKIILGLGTAHSPMVSEPPRLWSVHGEADKRNPRAVAAAYGGGDFEELSRQKASWIGREITSQKFEERYAAIQSALHVLTLTLRRVRPDALVVVGDDQDDVFQHEVVTPALAIYRGESVANAPRDTSKMPQFLSEAAWGYYPKEAAETYPCDSKLGTHLVESLIAQGFDATQLTQPPLGGHVGHAFTFLNRRLMNGEQIPYVPVMLNTYYPPNQPTAGRCYALGKALRAAVESWENDKTVAVVASGGLTHPILDEELDRKVIDALQRKDARALTELPEDIFRLGTSEIKNWITVARAMEASDLTMKLVDYIPAYRSVAGTGCGLTFAEWI